MWDEALGVVSYSWPDWRHGSIGCPHVQGGCVVRVAPQYIVRAHISRPAPRLHPMTALPMSSPFRSCLGLILRLGLLQVTVASSNNCLVCKMRYSIASRYCIHSNCVLLSIVSPPHRPVVCNPHLTLHPISVLNLFVPPVVLSRPQGTGVLLGHS